MTGGTLSAELAILRQAGVPVVANHEWLEPTGLARAEWLKYMALFPNDESGQQVALQVGAAYQKAGAQLVTDFFERERVDFVPLLTKLMAQGIDMIELDGNSPQTSGLMVKQARELGFKGAIVRTAGDATADILAVAVDTSLEDTVRLMQREAHSGGSSATVCGCR